MDRAVILYGAPGVGKDTVTASLSRLDARYRLFRRIKCGPGRTVGYRMVTAEQLAELRATGDVVYENRRYDAEYVVDRSGLLSFASTHRPVVHVGQPEAITALTAAELPLSWLVVELFCPRDVAERRVVERGGDPRERMPVFDQTSALALPGAVRIDTSTRAPDESAALIADHVDAIHIEAAQ